MTLYCTPLTETLAIANYLTGLAQVRRCTLYMNMCTYVYMITLEIERQKERQKPEANEK